MKFQKHYLRIHLQWKVYQEIFSENNMSQLFFYKF